MKPKSLRKPKSLLNSDFSHSNSDESVTHYYILLDNQALIIANNMWSENLFLGDESMDMLSLSSRNEVFNIFPELLGDLHGYGQKTRKQLRPKEVALLV